MTERITCNGCGFVLYWGEAIRDRMFMRYSEETFLAKYGFTCPHCDGELSRDTVTITYED